MRPIFCLLLLIWGILRVESLYAQSFPGRTTNQQALQDKSLRLSRAFKENFQTAIALARKNNWIIEQQLPDGSLISLQGIDERGLPVYYTIDQNTRAAATTRTNQLWAGGSLGLNLTGSSTLLTGRIGIWDGGPVRGAHKELKGRVVHKDSGTTVDITTGANHATHVAGTMIASGIQPYARGMANGVAQLQAWDFSNDEAEMAAAATNLLISNHSYGVVAGWRSNPSRSGTATDPVWEWYGDAGISQTEDYKFGFYNAEARNWDEITYNAPFYLPVKSAGNNRNSNGPAVGQPYWRRNTSGNFDLVSSRATNVSSNNGYDIIGTYAVAKNSLTVGAVEGLPAGANQPADIRIAAFSSWGPSDDGRIKPDLVGNGVAVFSCSAANNEAYATLNGTSMATPNISGTLLLLQEYYANRNSGTFMRAATLKGLAIHTTDEAGGAPGPDYIYGWGLLNAERAAQVITNSDGSHTVAEKTLQQGETHTIQVVASGKGPLKVTICWTDPPGTALRASASTLNNRKPVLVNDLDLRITNAGNTFMPWILDPNNPANPAAKGDNIRDNVEQVLISNAIPGKVYTLRVSHKATLQNGLQAYSLLISGGGGNVYCASQSTATTGSRIEAVTFGEINVASAACVAYSDQTELTTRVASGQVIPLEVKTGSCGSTAGKIIKAFIDWNSDGDFQEPNELIATSPVISGTGTFRTNITIPSGLTIGNSSRLRIVSEEATDATSVEACGNYIKGETEDYWIQFVRPSNDVGAVGLTFPDAVFCASTSQPVVVTLRNFGALVQTNIPVTTVIRDDKGMIATLKGTFTGSLLPFAETKVTLAGTFTALPGRSYTFSTTTTLATDQEADNNLHTSVRTTSNLPPAPLANATICAGQVAYLEGNEEGTLFWYDAAQGGQLVAAGNSVTTAKWPVSQTFYAGVNDFRGKLGPAGKATFNGGTYAGNFGPLPLLKTSVPLVIESVRLYIGTAGRITFTVQTPAGIPVSSTTLDVVPTRNPDVPPGSTSGQLADDPNDQGEVYLLNLAIPEPGDYQIAIAYENGASIFRSNAGVSGYPFSIPHVISLSGAFANGSILTNAYYYWYDIQVKALGCTSPRIKVVANVVESPPPAASLKGDTSICQGQITPLIVNLSGTPPWNLTLTNISDTTSFQFNGITTSPYRMSVSKQGKYIVSSLSDAKSCPTYYSEDTVQVIVNSRPVAQLSANKYTLTATPGTEYRWFLNGILLPEESTRQIFALAVGKYAVEITNEKGCSARSAEVQVSVTLTEAQSREILLYPNPTLGEITIRVGRNATAVQRIRVFNLWGQQIREIPYPATQPFVFTASLSPEPAGTYILVVEGQHLKKTFRVVKL